MLAAEDLLWWLVDLVLVLVSVGAVAEFGGGGVRCRPFVGCYC